MLDIVDNLHAPETYASEIAAYTLSHGKVTLTLATTRATWVEGLVSNRRVVVARVVLSVGAAQALSFELFDFLKKQGLDPTKHGMNPPQTAGYEKIQ